jgi:hypothetical protein
MRTSDGAHGVDEVMNTRERSRENRHEHAKADPRPNDEELKNRPAIERSEVGVPQETKNSLTSIHSERAGTWSCRTTFQPLARNSRVYVAPTRKPR